MISNLIWVRVKSGLTARKLNESISAYEFNRLCSEVTAQIMTITLSEIEEALKGEESAST